MAATPKPVRKVAKKFGKTIEKGMKAHSHFDSMPKKQVKKVKEFNEKEMKRVSKVVK